MYLASNARTGIENCGADGVASRVMSDVRCKGMSLSKGGRLILPIQGVPGNESLA